MNQRILFSLVFFALGVSFMAVNTTDGAPPRFMKMFGRSSKAEATEGKLYELSEEDGPWLILASTLVGEGAKERANQLAFELRRDLGLNAFIYKEKFDFTKTLRHDPVTSRRVRYANQYQYDAYAVLVGEYDRVDHPHVERDLKRIKTATLPSLVAPDAIAAELNTKNPATTIKVMATKFKAMTKDRQPGPMAGAFVTRNPILPPEYFQAPTVDSFVSQLNEDFSDNNLLDCPGKFTVVVKTFQGYSTIVDGKKEKKFVPNGKRLDRMAKQAQFMVSKLREQGVESYQFHDRERSLVTIGSFDSLGRQLPDGGFEYDPAIKNVMRQYSALNVQPELARQLPPGKRTGNNIGMIPFDIHPTPIAVPRQSKRSLYGMTRGRQ